MKTRSLLWMLLLWSCSCITFLTAEKVLINERRPTTTLKMSKNTKPGGNFNDLLTTIPPKKQPTTTRKKGMKMVPGGKFSGKLTTIPPKKEKRPTTTVTPKMSMNMIPGGNFNDLLTTIPPKKQPTTTLKMSTNIIPGGNFNDLLTIIPPTKPSVKTTTSKLMKTTTTTATTTTTTTTTLPPKKQPTTTLKMATNMLPGGNFNDLLTTIPPTIASVKTTTNKLMKTATTTTTATTTLPPTTAATATTVSQPPPPPPPTTTAEELIETVTTTPTVTATDTIQQTTVTAITPPPLGDMPVMTPGETDMAPATTSTTTPLVTATTPPILLELPKLVTRPPPQAMIAGGFKTAVLFEPELMVAEAPAPEIIVEESPPPQAMISGGFKTAVAFEPELMVAETVAPQIIFEPPPQAMISGGFKTAVAFEPELMVAEAPAPEIIVEERPPPQAMISGGLKTAVAFEPELLMVAEAPAPEIIVEESPPPQALISGGFETAVAFEPELMVAETVGPMIFAPPPQAMISGGFKTAVAIEPEIMVAVLKTPAPQLLMTRETPETAEVIAGGLNIAVEPEMLLAPDNSPDVGTIAGGIAFASEPELLLAPIAAEAAELSPMESAAPLENPAMGAASATPATPQMAQARAASTIGTTGSTIANMQMARAFQQVTPAMAMATPAMAMATPAMAMAAPAMAMAAATDTTPTTSTSTTASITTTAPEIAINIQEIKNLFNTLLTNYDTRIRPRRDQLNSVKLHTTFVPNSIIEFDTQEQKFAIMGYFKIEWWDQLLGWTPADYSGAEILKIPASEIWTPALVIGKAFTGKNIIGQSSSDIVLVHWLGYVQWVPEGTYSVVCEVNIQFYPFDIQTCSLTYYVTDETSDKVNLTFNGDMDLSELLPNSEWDVLNVTTSTATKNNATHVSFTFTVKRRGEFALFTVIMPLLMLSCLNGFVFLVPIDTGEKGSFAITIFLAYGVFVTIVIDTLPHNSLQVSYFVLYILSLLALSVFLVFYTILQSKIVMSVGDKPCNLKLPSRKPRAVAPTGNMIGPQVFTWRMFLKCVDTWMFAVFAVVVVSDTTMFLVSVVEQVSLF